VEMPTAENPVVVHNGDCLDLLPRLGGVDAVVTDPPYALTDKHGPRIPQYGNGRGAQEERARRGNSKGFMGMHWDGDLPGVEHWQAVLRVLKPGGYMLAFGGTRTYHRLTCAIEDAGFEVRDCLMWVHAQGFPKGQGCLKPAWEPILLARKPGERVLPLGIDECRVPALGGLTSGGRCVGSSPAPMNRANGIAEDRERSEEHPAGRYPANVLHDGSDEVMEAFAAFGEKSSNGGGTSRGIGYESSAAAVRPIAAGDSGSAARFFYCAKASKAERGEGNTHPTVKPLELMRWLVRLVTPEGGVVLDPFAGSGTTGEAALVEGRRAILIERESAYCDIIRRRLDHASGTGAGSLFAGATN